MKTLIVYYTLEGNVAYLAETLGNQLQGRCYFLEPAKAYPKKGLIKYLFGGKDAVFGKGEALKNPLPNLDGYDLILVGTPVWASRPAPPVQTFLEKADLKGKAVGFFASHKGGGADKCFARMKEKLDETVKYLGDIEFQNAKDGDRELIEQHLANWIENLEI